MKLTGFRKHSDDKRIKFICHFWMKKLFTPYITPDIEVTLYKYSFFYHLNYHQCERV
jgi:hypothetical protein